MPPFMYRSLISTWLILSSLFVDVYLLFPFYSLSVYKTYIRESKSLTYSLYSLFRNTSHYHIVHIFSNFIVNRHHAHQNILIQFLIYSITYNKRAIQIHVGRTSIVLTLRLTYIITTGKTGLHMVTVIHPEQYNRYVHNKYITIVTLN